MATPYNTGKVLIGIAYQPRPAPIGGDMVKIQTGLLDKSKPSHWLLELIWRLL